MKFFRRHKILAALIVLAALVLFAVAWDASAAIRGTLAARMDLARGRYVVLAYGLPPAESEEYARLLKERYGIEYRQAALCLISPELVAYAGSYNKLSIAAAESRFHRDLFRETREDAQRIWLHRTSGYGPRQIVDYLFSSIPDKPREPACFRSLKPEMSMKAVVQKCGRPDEDTGRDAYAFLYHLPEGRTVTITTARLNSFQTVSYTDGALPHSPLPRPR
jgi:hypothetical protein